MHTPPQPYLISRGQPLALQLEAGSELFCHQGRLLLEIAPPGLADHPFGQQIPLHTGQGWRAASHSHVQLHAADAQAVQVMLHSPQRQQSRPAPETEAGRLGQRAPGLGARMVGWWIRLRRGQRAA